MRDSALFQAFVYLLAGVLAVPVAKRLGLGSVLGYLFAGVCVGPAMLGLVGGGESDVMHFAEFGVVMMLFVIGLELRPALLWRLRAPILGLGGAQVSLTAALVAGISLALGLPWPQAVVCGLILALSSTAIVLQSLGEKGLLKTRGGEACFSVLLFQDIAVIPILAILPLLANAAGAQAAGEAAHASPISQWPGWAQALTTIAAVAGIITGGRFLLRPIFRFIATTRLREVFTATALLLVIGIALLMQVVGLSAALGTFIAGVVLADSEYRHQLEADIEPFKGLLLGLFFISVGAGIDFGLMANQPGLIATLVIGLIGLKFTALVVLGRGFRLEGASTLLFAFALAQGGEFCFVLLSMAGQLGVLDAAISKPLVATVALSMALTPLLLLVNEKFVQPRFRVPKIEREPDEIDEHENPVILAGFGRFGHVVGRLLRANGFGVTVLDNDPDQVETLAKFGLKSFYGDASRLDLLTAAGADRAKVFICAVDNDAQALKIIEMVQTSFPHLKIIARATSRQHAYELIQHGVTIVHRDTFASAVDLSVDALRVLGFRGHQAERAARLFKRHDERALREMVKLLGDEQAYVSAARQHIVNLEEVLRADRGSFRGAGDAAWEPPRPAGDDAARR